MTKIKKKKSIASTCWLLLVGLQTGTTTLEINLAFTQKMGIDLPEDPAIPHLGLYPPNHKNMYSSMFIAAIFIITRSWKYSSYREAENQVAALSMKTGASAVPVQY
jgi:hypothetical protein